MTFPHLSFALILIALSFGLYEASVSEDKVSLALLGGVCGLILGFIHAVNLVVVCSSVGAFALLSLLFKEPRALRSAIAFGAVSVWPLVYYTVLMLNQPDLLPQVPVRSPTPLSYLVGFAPFLILSAVHVGGLIKKRTLPRTDLFLLCWIIVNFLLLYSYPLLSQEGRAVLGIQVPLVILSTRAIFGSILPSRGLDWQTSDRPSKKLPGAAIVGLIVIFTLPSTFCNIYERVSRLRESPMSFSLTLPEYEALRVLGAIPGEGAVLSGDWIGNFVPRLTGKYSWLGLYDLPSHDSRLSQARMFFSEETTASERFRFLKDNNIRYVFHGPGERALGGFQPDHADFLEPIFRHDAVVVYRVILPEKGHEKERA